MNTESHKKDNVKDLAADMIVSKSVIGGRVRARRRVPVRAAGLAALAIIAAVSMHADAAQRPQFNLVRTLDQPNGANGLAWHPEGNFLAVSQTIWREIVVWDIEPPKIVWQFDLGTMSANNIAFVTSENAILTGPLGASLRTSPEHDFTAALLIDFSAKTVKRRFSGTIQSRFPSASNPARLFELSPDESLLAVRYRGDDSTIGVYQIHDGALRHKISLLGEFVSALAIDPSGQHLAVGTRSSKVFVFDLQNGSEINNFIVDSWLINDIEFSLNGEYMAASAGTPFRNSNYISPIRVFRTSGEVVARFPANKLEHCAQGSNKLSWISGDGIVFGGTDGGLRYWSISDVRGYTTIYKFNSMITGLKFNRRSQQIAVSAQNTVRIYRVD